MTIVEMTTSYTTYNYRSFADLIKEQKRPCTTLNIQDRYIE